MGFLGRKKSGQPASVDPSTAPPPSGQPAAPQPVPAGQPVPVGAAPADAATVAVAILPGVALPPWATRMPLTQQLMAAQAYPATISPEPAGLPAEPHEYLPSSPGLWVDVPPAPAPGSAPATGETLRAPVVGGRWVEQSPVYLQQGTGEPTLAGIAAPRTSGPATGGTGQWHEVAAGPVGTGSDAPPAPDPTLRSDQPQGDVQWSSQAAQVEPVDLAPAPYGFPAEDPPKPSAASAPADPGPATESGVWHELPATAAAGASLAPGVWHTIAPGEQEPPSLQETSSAQSTPTAAPVVQRTAQGGQQAPDTTVSGPATGQSGVSHASPARYGDPTPGMWQEQAPRNLTTPPAPVEPLPPATASPATASPATASPAPAKPTRAGTWQEQPPQSLGGTSIGAQPSPGPQAPAGEGDATARTSTGPASQASSPVAATPPVIPAPPVPAEPPVEPTPPAAAAPPVMPTPPATAEPQPEPSAQSWAGPQSAPAPEPTVSGFPEAEPAFGADTGPRDPSFPGSEPEAPGEAIPAEGADVSWAPDVAGLESAEGTSAPADTENDWMTVEPASTDEEWSQAPATDWASDWEATGDLPDDDAAWQTSWQGDDWQQQGRPEADTTSDWNSGWEVGSSALVEQASDAPTQDRRVGWDDVEPSDDGQAGEETEPAPDQNEADDQDEQDGGWGWPSSGPNAPGPAGPTSDGPKWAPGFSPDEQTIDEPDVATTQEEPRPDRPEGPGAHLARGAGQLRPPAPTTTAAGLPLTQPRRGPALSGTLTIDADSGFDVSAPMLDITDDTLERRAVNRRTNLALPVAGHQGSGLPPVAGRPPVAGDQLPGNRPPRRRWPLVLAGSALVLGVAAGATVAVVTMTQDPEAPVVSTIALPDTVADLQLAPRPQAEGWLAALASEASDSMLGTYSGDGVTAKVWLLPSGTDFATLMARVRSETEIPAADFRDMAPGLRGGQLACGAVSATESVCVWSTPGVSGAAIITGLARTPASQLLADMREGLEPRA